MICVSLSSGTTGRILSILGQVEMAELRLDLLDLGARDVVKIFKSKKCKLIATCRPGRYQDPERQSLLATAIESGADYVDIELESSPDFTKPLLELAKKKRCKVIVSYHDFKKTPETKTLRIKINNCFQKGANIAKIACFVKKPIDNLRLLRLLEGDQDIVVIGMGDAGKITRISAPSLGSPFTYASWDSGSETAPGQLTYKQLLAVYKNMGVETE